MSDVGNLNVRVGMDSTGFQQGVSQLNQEMRRVKSEFHLATSELGKHGTELDRLKVRSESLTQQTDLQRQKVGELEAAHRHLVETKGADAKATQDMEVRLNKARTELNNMERDLGSINAEIEKQSSSWYKLSESLDQVGTKMQNVGKQMTDVGKTFSMRVTAPIVGLAAAAVKVGSDFEAGMSQVAAISGATGDELERLSDLAEEMGRSTKFSATESAEAMNYMAMAGWNTEQILGGLEGVMMLAAASGESLASVSDIATDSLTAFGMSAEESSDFADLLAQTSTSANVTVGEMGETFKYAAPLFGAMGYSAEDAALAIGLMGDAGIKGSQAGTSLRGALVSLADPSEAAGNALDELGISITDSNGDMLPFIQVMDNLRGAFGGLTEQQQAQYASTIFGRNAMSGMLAVINAGEEEYNNLAEATRDYNGAASEMADIMQDNLQGQLTRLKAALEGLGIQIFRVIGPHLERFVAILQRVVEFLGNLPEPVLTVVVAMAALAAAVGPVLVVLGTIITQAGVVTAAIGKLVAAFGAKTAVFGVAAKAAGVLAAAKGALAVAIGAISAPIAIAVAAIVGLIAIGVALYRNWDDVKRVAQEVFQFLGEFLSSTVDWMGERLSDLMAWFGELPERIRESLSTLITNIGNAFQLIWETMVTWISDAMDATVQFFAELPGRIWERLLEAIDRILDFGRNAFDAAAEAGRDFVEGFLAPIRALPERVGEIMGNIRGAITGAASNLAGAARNAGSRLTQGWRDGMGERSPSYIERSMSRIVDFMDESVDGLGGQFQRLSGMRAEPMMRASFAGASVPGMGSGGSGTSYGDTVVNLNGAVSIREDADIEKLAQELDRLRRRRGRGV